MLLAQISAVALLDTCSVAIQPSQVLFPNASSLLTVRDLQQYTDYNVSECCAACEGNEACATFTVYTPTQQCFLHCEGNALLEPSNMHLSGKRTDKPPPPDATSCSPQEQVGFAGTDTGNAPANTSAQCCALCDERIDCHHYTFDVASRTCFFKHKEVGGGPPAASHMCGQMSGSVPAKVYPPACGAINEGVTYSRTNIIFDGYVKVTTLFDCCRACSNRTDDNDRGSEACTHWSYNTYGDCYLINPAGDQLTMDEDAIFVSGGIPPPSPSPVTSCSSDNDCELGLSCLCDESEHYSRRVLLFAALPHNYSCKCQ